MKGRGPLPLSSLVGAAICSQLAGCAPRANEPSDSGGDLQSLCGAKSELRDVELYAGESAVTAAFVSRHRLAVGMLRWRDDLVERYREESGNVAGRGWCTGTLIADDLFLTAGHCLEGADTPTFQLPREKGGARLEPPEMAREFVVELRFETPAVASAPS